MQHTIQALGQIDRKGIAGRAKVAPLLAKGLIEVCESRPEINRPFGSFRLTKAGRKMLDDSYVCDNRALCNVEIG